ncbi:MAG: IS66 family insertion sequence element accessory protein TnpB [Paludibacteraceae bacterium]|nr:IS66 family insertion sequence element accessory protein TnpB [Paludibacteraceae bacterium]
MKIACNLNPTAWNLTKNSWAAYQSITIHSSKHLRSIRFGKDCKFLFGRDPYNGDVFITMSKKRDKVKLVRYENHAYMVFMKAYEHGFQFLVPKPSEEGKTSYLLSLSKLQALMECTARKEIKI